MTLFEVACHCAKGPMRSLLLNYDVRAIFGDPKILKKGSQVLSCNTTLLHILEMDNEDPFPYHSSSRECCDSGTFVATFGSTTKAVGLFTEELAA